MESKELSTQESHYRRHRPHPYCHATRHQLDIPRVQPSHLGPQLNNVCLQLHASPLNFRSQFPCGSHPIPLPSNLNEAEFKQYLNPVGLGPSGKI